MRLSIFAGTGVVTTPPSVGLVAHTGVAGASATTSAIDTTGASLLVAAVCIYSSSPAVTPSDSKGNTWVPLTFQTTAFVTASVQLFYCLAPTVGTGHTFTSSPSDFQAIAVAAFSGLTAADLDVADVGGTGGTVAAGSGTPAHPNEVIVTALGSYPYSGTVACSGYTITDQLPGQAGVHTLIALAYQIQTTATPVAPSWTGAALAGVATTGSWA